MKRAVVMGGSYAGLFAARVLSEYAEEVVVLEADGAVGEDGIGTRAPQRRQLHALLAMGHSQLERWFPGITAELVAGGALLGEGDDVAFYLDGRRKVAAEGTRMLGATRPFLEAAVRRRVAGLTNVRLVTARATGLVVERGRVGGVSTADGEVFEAEFAVDATGRSSRLGNWLEEDGWERAPVSRMRIDLGYATGTFRRGDELGSTVVVHGSPGPASGYRPTVTEPGGLVAVEDDRWSVVLAGYAGDRPGQDPEEFRARMRRCVEPLRTVADACEMAGPVETFHVAESLRRDYLRLGRFPGGLVVLGDALASVNPVYGQGLTLAALQANSLAAHLRSGASPRDPARGYFRRAATVVDAAWQLSTTADLAQPHVDGPYPPGYPLIRWVGDRITEASIVDRAVNTTYTNVLNMVEHPRALTRPGLLLRTARVLLTRAR
ncbi:NAD(P)/FAD-dependent oxidoreductase [Streptomyces sp. NPDC004327]|uniref:NAD(P)/FAD-dependent oxidoreductase n=1 Tax=Streptomyces sp. NPDC004327 TaxID=3364699 RepID=UPI0036AE7D44